jgi:hypothetical protein
MFVFVVHEAVFIFLVTVQVIIINVIISVWSVVRCMTHCKCFDMSHCLSDLTYSIQLDTKYVKLLIDVQLCFNYFVILNALAKQVLSNNK